MIVESEEDIWKKVRKRSEVIKKEMGLEPRLESKQVVIFKDVDVKEAPLSERSISDERLEKMVNESISRIERENLAKRVADTKARLAKQDQILKELNKSGVDTDMVIEIETGKQIEKMMNEQILKSDCSKADAMKVLMQNPRFVALWKQYESEYAAAGRVAMQARRDGE